MSLDLRVVSHLLGLLMLVFSSLILALAGFAYADHLAGMTANLADLRALLVAAAGGAFLGFALLAMGKKPGNHLGQREALLLVALSWFIGAAVGALPFRLWSVMRPDAATTPHSFDSSINCYFESISGLTTTGATILPVISSVPRSLLLWRATTHWLGGLGIVVLFVAVLPILGVGGRRVYRIESPGPTPEGVRPRIQDAARALWFIYMGLTLIEVLALRLAGMGWFDSVCHTFATLATGGFSTLDSSIAGFHSTLIHVVIIVFMILAGVNFSLFHQLLHKQWRTVVKDPELRAYLAIMVVGTVIITVSLLQRGAATPDSEEAMGVGRVVRDSLFQVVSIQTTTGFCTADFDTWGFVAKTTLLMLMFCGACAGSTGGGIKVVRILIALKILVAEIEHVYRRTVVRSVKIGKSAIDSELKINRHHHGSHGVGRDAQQHRSGFGQGGRDPELRMVFRRGKDRDEYPDGARSTGSFYDRGASHAAVLAVGIADHKLDDWPRVNYAGSLRVRRAREGFR